MFKNIIKFIKYNNAVVFIILFIFLLASGVFAQTEVGQDIIGGKQSEIQGVDNTLLLESDLDTFDMDFKIEKIETDEHYYYVTYTYLDLVKEDDVWQYLMQEKVRKVSKIIRVDLGDFLAEELSEQYTARINDLKIAQNKAQNDGVQKKVEVSYYDGLIGQTLSLVDKAFPGYEPVKIKELPSPTAPSLLSLTSVDEGSSEQTVDNLTEVYNDYVNNMDPDKDDVIGNNDNCPYDYNPGQEDGDQDGKGDVCDSFDNQVLDVDSDDSVATTSATSSDDIVGDLSIDEEQASSSLDNTLEEDILTSSSSDIEFDIASGSEQTVEIIELN